jgi:probable HAF family extracellular repeat protein
LDNLSAAAYEHATFAPISIVPPVPTVSVRVVDPLASEGTSDKAELLFERNGNTDSQLTIGVGFTGSATAGTDYTVAGLSSPTSIHFQAGETTKSLEITALADGSSDPTESIIVTIVSNPSAYTVGTPAGTVYIGDSGQTLVAITAADPFANELGGDLGEVVFHRAGKLTETKNVSFSGSGSAIRDYDYTLLSLGTATSVHFGINVPKVSVFLQGIFDTLVENPAETATLQITGSGYSIASPSSATITIHEPPTVSVFAIDSVAAESGIQQGVFKFTRTGSLSSILNVNFALPIPPGTAVRGSDYILDPDSTSFTFNSGEAEKIVRVIPVKDATTEPAELIVLQIAADQYSPYLVSAEGGSSEMTIVDGGSVAVPISYTIQAIGVPSYATSWDSSGYHINNRTTLINGQTVITPRIVGDYRPDPNYYYQRAFRAFNSGIEYTLNPYLGFYSYAYGINDDNIVVGRTTYYNANIPDHPCKWSANGIQTLLGRLPGNGANDTAVAINNSGVIVGSCRISTTSTNMHAVRWAAGSTAADDMNAILGGPVSTSFAYGINDAGRVVGKSEINGSGSAYHAFMTAANQDISPSSDLGTMNGGAGNSEATAINSFNEVVGASDTSSGETLAFLKAPATGANSGFIKLGALPGGNRSLALGINNSGHVVGTSRTTLTGSNRAFVYFSGQGMINLNSLPLINGAGWTLTSAEEINNSGYIVGRGTRNGFPTTFVLSPNF